MAQVRLEHVRKVYPDGFVAVADASFEVADGELLVLVGPSGCGKSTTLRMIAGLEEITDGDIAIGGTVVNDVPPKDRDIAMVFQNYALYPHMTVYENMSFGLRPEHIVEQRAQLEPHQHPFEAELDVTEPMGMETMVFFRLAGTDICGRVHPNAGAQAGQRMKLAADLANMHLIDDETAQVL